MTGASDVVVRINGVETAHARLVGAGTQAHLGPSADTGSLSFDTVAPTVGQQIEIALITESPERLLFGGELQLVAESYDGDTSNARWDATLIDRTFKANRRRPFGTWTNVSASTIALAIAAAYAPDCTTTAIAGGLPAITIAFDGSQPFMTCLQAIATAVGNGCRATLSYANDLGLFTTDVGPAADPLDDNHRPLNNPPITFSVDLSQVRTRLYGKGVSVNTLSDVLIAETILPVQDVTAFGQGSPTAGKGILALAPSASLVQVFDYAGVQVGGTTSTVAGVTVSPSNLTSAGTVTGVAGNLTGSVQYAYTETFADGGESELSARTSTVTCGPIALFVTNLPTFTAAAGGNLTASTQYWYVFAALDSTGARGTGAGSSAYTGTTGVGQGTINIGNLDTCSDARATGRIIFRTKAGGSSSGPFYECARISNVGATFSDQVADTALGTVFPASFLGTGGNQADVVIPAGSASSSGVNIYRTQTGDPTGSLYLAGSLSGNAGGTYRDNATNANLKTLAPSASQVSTTAGSVSLPVADCAQFYADGGWLTNGIRYGGRSTSTGAGLLTGIPATGTGSIAAALKFGAALTTTPALTGVNLALSPSGVTQALAKGSSVAVWVQRDDAAAQTALAALEGGDGIREDTLFDSTLDETALTAAMDARLDQFSRAIVSCAYDTLNPTQARPGASILIDLSSAPGAGGFDPAVFDPRVFDEDFGPGSATYTIQDVAMGFYGPRNRPRYSVQASSVAFTVMDVLRLALIQQGT